MPSTRQRTGFARSRPKSALTHAQSSAADRHAFAGDSTMDQVQHQHHDTIFKSMKDMKLEDTISHECGLTMNVRVESRAIAEVMAKKPGIRVTYLTAMIRIDGEGKITFKMPEIS